MGKSSKFSKRKATDCPIFRSPTEFARMLLTKEDVIKCLTYEGGILDLKQLVIRNPHFLPYHISFVKSCKCCILNLPFRQFQRNVLLI